MRTKTLCSKFKGLLCVLEMRTAMCALMRVSRAYMLHAHVMSLSVTYNLPTISSPSAQLFIEEEN